MEKTSYKTKFKRVIKSGFFSFWRSGFVSFASILVMVITLSVITSAIFLGAILNLTLVELKNKVDVNVYFLTTAPESDILALKSKIESLPEIQKVEYINRETALQNFKDRNATRQSMLQALSELDDNPLGAVLNIKAKEPSQYESLVSFLEQEKLLSKDGENIIDKVNYLENKTAIDRLSKIIDSANRLGTTLTIALILVSVMITFNTIRLAIYISRDEISVMQLVGASKNYIKGPFVVSGVIYGAVSGLITIFIFLPITYWLGTISQSFFIGLNIFSYYIGNIFQIIFVVLGAGIAIGAVSSLLAVRRYLKL